MGASWPRSIRRVGSTVRVRGEVWGCGAVRGRRIKFVVC